MNIVSLIGNVDVKMMMYINGIVLNCRSKSIFLSLSLRDEKHSRHFLTRDSGDYLLKYVYY